MNGGVQVKNVSGSNLKFYLRTMQMDLEEAKSGNQQKDIAILSPVSPQKIKNQLQTQPKIAFDTLAQEIKSKPPTMSQSAASALEEDMGHIAPQKQTSPSPQIPDQKETQPPLPSTRRPEEQFSSREYLELRPLKKPEPVTTTAPAPSYVPSRPPITPRGAFTRELEPHLQNKLQKSSSFHIPKLVWTILILLVIGFGFIAFGGLEFINNFINQPTNNIPPTTTPPTPLPPGTNTPPNTTPPTQIPHGTKLIEISQSQKTNLKNTLRSALAENYSLNTLTPVTIRYIENKQSLSFSDFWDALGVVLPFGLIDSVEETFTLAVYTNGADAKRFGIRMRIRSGADATQLRNQLLSWEPRLVSDWQILLSSLPVQSSGQFQTITLLGERARFINTDLADLGIYYSVLADRRLLLIGTSRETLEALIANER